MKMWKKMAALVLGGAMVLSQGMVSFADETEVGAESVEAGAGSDVMDDGSMALGSGIGKTAAIGDALEQEGLVGLVGMGAEAGLGAILSGDAAAGAVYGGYDNAGDTDTVMLDDILLSLKIAGSYMLTNAEDKYFHYIYTWGQQSIPYIIVGAYNWDTTEGFYDQFNELMRDGRPDLEIVEGPVSVTIGDKNLEKVVYSFTKDGYKIQDTRYIWVGPNNILYMFGKKEVPEIEYTLGSTLEDIIAGASVMGEETTEPDPETDAPQPETTAPQPETTAPQPETTAPQPETTAPQTGGDRLYMQNADSSWTVSTKYYGMTIPAYWTGHFDASVLEQDNGGYYLQVVNKESADANLGGHLFTIMLIPENEDYTYLPSYDYLGTMATPEGNFSVVIQYPTDVQTGDVWQEFYKILNADKNSAISSMRPKAGVTWTLPNGNTVSGDSSEMNPQPETTAPQPETTAPQPETTAPAGSGDVLGTTSGNSYSNGMFGMNFTAPAGWILATQDQLVSLNGGLSADQFASTIESGNPVCIAYAQSADGMEVMNVYAMNGQPYMDASMQSLSQEDCQAILQEAMSSSTAALESYGATVTGASINTVNCMGQTCYSLDITFDYAGYSGTQKQIGIPAGTYFAMITVQSVSGDNTQTTLDMFSAL